MSRMTVLCKTSLIGVVLVAILAIVVVYGLFHGYFDHGQFEIKQVQRSSKNQLAMLVERSDNDALGGLVYYVLIGNHLFTPAELRRAYYSNAVVFDASRNCLMLHWDGPDRLTIRCNGSTLDSDHINAQRKQLGEVTISYENIALK